DGEDTVGEDSRPDHDLIEEGGGDAAVEGVAGTAVVGAGPVAGDGHLALHLVRIEMQPDGIVGSTGETARVFGPNLFDQGGQVLFTHVFSSPAPALPSSPVPGKRAVGSVPPPAERGRARAILNRLRQRYPEIHTALDYRSPWELLVATVMSAQTTDENVNRVAPVLFERFRGPGELAEADPEEVEKIIFSTGFYRQKTKSIIRLAVAVEEEHGGVVPDTLEQLVTLPGVGRKTASVVLAEAWGRP